MKKHFLILLISIYSVISIFSQQLTLVENGKSDYSIIISKNAGKHERTAASILQDYVEKLSTCRLPVADDTKRKSEYEILIGYTNRSKKKKKELYDLRKDGYRIKTSGSKLIITGGSEKGIIYGVTGFLEDHLGVRKFTPDAEYIPESKTISISAIDDVQIPPADIRIVHCEFTKDSLYSYFRKITSIEDIWNDGQYHGYYVHTFSRSVPPDKYFGAHPEYFALINGKRVPYGQLCLTNADVLEIVKKDIGDQISEHPGLHYWSVSQNDNYYHCECDKCRAINEEEGSPSGLMLRFVNEVAKVYPEKTITTLAYQYTRKPPLKTKPLKNVMVTLCTIELNRSKPIESDPASADFVKEIQDWAKISDNIKIWDYETQFTNSFGPFPLYNTLKPNIQFFTKNNVNAHFQQCNGKHSENLSELKCYVLSKLLWNPKAPSNSITNEFLFGFYGDAAPYIRMYFDKLHEETRKSGISLDIYGTPIWLADNVLSESNMAKYNEYFDKAEKAVRDDMILYNRVRAARLPLMFSSIEIAKTDLFGKRG
jgi:hypothetical protein